MTEPRRPTDDQRRSGTGSSDSSVRTTRPRRPDDTAQVDRLAEALRSAPVVRSVQSAPVIRSAWQALPDRARRGARAAGRLSLRMIHETVSDRLHGLAAEASFWTMLSLPPLLLALMALTGQLGAVLGANFANQVATALLNWADGVFTDQTMQQVVRPLIVSTLREGHSGVLSLSLLIALWSGSAALSNYISAITVAYDMEGLRSFWRTRLLSLSLYLAALVIGTILLPMLVLGPRVLSQMLSGLPDSALTWLVSAGYWPVVSLLSLLALTSLYHVAVPVRTRWRRDVPGAVLALLIWTAGSVGLRTYLGSGMRSDGGPAAAPIAILLFFFVTALAVLLGAELNATIDDMWPEPATQEGRRTAREQQRARREREDEHRQEPDEPGEP
ncbi:YihY/virulence factor BrkB family protein [Mangrovihabitans endophyticus]|uniref:YihY family inner membrane protein n=1 Tax=Mangrovihabitans endophyticus TaxID=1751298 RepID=A0A8J3FQ40_9ACTN|nr:YihY/virulence factor BrkB family protein [Mangrovihabitans endophyticus]GGL00441.1 hypothetical protein GCM10012284_38600 [Mangrovihabitans endophyticus]